MALLGSDIPMGMAPVNWERGHLWSRNWYPHSIPGVTDQRVFSDWDVLITHWPLSALLDTQTKHYLEVTLQETVSIREASLILE